MDGGRMVETSSRARPRAGDESTIRRRSRLIAAGSTAAAMVVAACSPAAHVAVDRADASPAVALTDVDHGSERDAPDAAVPSDGDISSGPDVSGSDAAERDPTDTVPREPEPPIVAVIDWDGCDDFGVPSAAEIFTDAWECGSLTVDMDPFDAGDHPPVELAVTRHPASVRSMGTLVLNPGGPGQTGVDLAWNLWGSLPLELTRSFDIVGWDPRGTGRSAPAIRCESGADPFTTFRFVEGCVERTGELAGHLAAPYSAADMEAIRVALGEDQLDYIGFSYGTALGAAYAAAYPDHVGSFVLDGPIDPMAGDANGPVDEAGLPLLAGDGFPDARARMLELCDASVDCLADRSAVWVVEDLIDVSTLLDAPWFGDGGLSVTGFDVDRYVDSTTLSVYDWVVLGVALDDAAERDDGSLIAAHLEFLGEGLGASSSEADPGEAAEAAGFVEAYLMIYCADFADMLGGPLEACAGIPRDQRNLEPVGSVETQQPILVVGTQFDPSTPGYHAPDFAEALGDAVAISWEGVGHTVFPGISRCIDDQVVDFLLRDVVPDTSPPACPFVDDISTESGIGDRFFGLTRDEARRWLAGTFDVRADFVGDPACAAEVIVPPGDLLSSDERRRVVHVVMDLSSPTAAQAMADVAASDC